MWPPKRGHHSPVQRRQVGVAYASCPRRCALGHRIDTVVARFTQRVSASAVHVIIFGHFANPAFQSADTSRQNVGRKARFVSRRLHTSRNKTSVGRKRSGETTKIAWTIARHRRDFVKRLQHESANIVTNEAMAITAKHNGLCHSHTKCTAPAKP